MTQDTFELIQVLIASGLFIFGVVQTADMIRDINEPRWMLKVFGMWAAIAAGIALVASL